MSAIPPALLSKVQKGEVTGCFVSNGQWYYSQLYVDEPSPCPVDNYDSMMIWALASLAKRRGLRYTQNNKKEYIKKLREQDANGSAPPVISPSYDSHINYDRLNWHELYEIAHVRKMPLRDHGKRWRKDRLVEALRNHEAEFVRR